MKKIDELKPDKRFKNLIRLSEEQIKAIEQIALEQGEIYAPIYYWQEKGFIIDGYAYCSILKSHPDIQYTTKPLPFANWKDALNWVIEQNISKPSLNLWQKLELGFQSEDYWENKAKAKKNIACTSGVQAKDKIDTLQVIADTIGCGRTTVANFQRILNSGKMEVIGKCRNGELLINSTCKELFPPKSKSKGKSKSGPKGKEPPAKPMITEDCDIFEECAKNIDTGKKNIRKLNGTPPDPNPIVDKIQKAEVPDGAVWIVLHRDRGALQVVKKSKKDDAGRIHIKLNAYRCTALESKDGVLIFEANHINGSEESRHRKDETEFDKAAG